MFHYTYVLQSSKDRELYVGYTTDVRRRFQEHNQGKNLSTKSKRPWRLIFYEAYLDGDDAKRREKYLKSNQGARLLKRMLKEYLYKLSKQFVLTAIFVATFFVGGTTIDAHAAQLVPHVPAQSIGVHDKIVVPIVLDTEGDSVNAIEGVLQYPDTLTLVEIRDGSSIVNFWLTRPKEGNNSVEFSGVIPGGVRGVGELFTLVFEGHAQGSGTFALNDAVAYQNDGQGTALPFTLARTSLTISGEGTGQEITEAGHIEDTEPPESFTPEVVSNPNLYEGQYVVVFATQDKGTGIAGYEVAEARGWYHLFSMKALSWHSAQSPFVLTDQTRRSYIYVRAKDRAGNERVERLSPGTRPLYENPLAIAGILIVLILLVIAGRRYARFRKPAIHP